MKTSKEYKRMALDGLKNNWGLAIIVLIGLLASFAVINVVSYYKSSADNAVISQEAQVLDAANLAITDFCNRPVSSSVKRERCVYNDTTPNGLVKLDGSGHGYVCLNKVKDAGYYTSEITLSKTPCIGYVLYDANNGKYENGKTYLFCVNAADKSVYEYQTTTSGFIDYLIGCGYDVK